MSKKNKRPEVTETEIVQEEAVLSDEIEDTKEAEENMEEIIEDIITEEPAAEIPAEPEAAEPEAPAAEEAPAAGEAPAAEEAPAVQESAHAAPIEGKTTGKITKPVNFRTGPSFGKASIMELKPGAAVTVTGSVEGDKGTWYECEFDGRTGYVKATGINIAK